MVKSPVSLASPGKPPSTQQSSLSPMRKSWDGSATGNERSRMPCTRVKMAVLAPMPSASVMTAVSVKPGALRNWRNA